MSSPSGDQVAAAFLAPEVGVDALKDAVVAIKCAAAYDQEGLSAVINGSKHPRSVVAAIAAIAAVICRQGGLDDAGIAALLPWIASQLTDLPARPEAACQGW